MNKEILLVIFIKTPRSKKSCAAVLLKGLSREIETGCWWYEWIEHYMKMIL
jgi:hypothetical protein